MASLMSNLIKPVDALELLDLEILLVAAIIG